MGENLSSRYWVGGGGPVASLDGERAPVLSGYHTVF